MRTTRTTVEIYKCISIYLLDGLYIRTLIRAIVKSKKGRSKNLLLLLRLLFFLILACSNTSLAIEGIITVIESLLLA